MSLIVGVGAVAIGLVAMVRAGIDGSFETPTVEVLGFTHTAWLGLAGGRLGMLLVLAGTVHGDVPSASSSVSPW